MDFLKYKTLGPTLTSYDLLKSLAVVMMMIDHVGAYIYTEDMAWRWLGSSAPIWFFLVGYASSRHMGPLLWTGALILICANAIAGFPFFPLNILAVILLVRACLDPLMRFAGTRPGSFCVAVLLITLLMPLGMITLEYGTLGFLLAMFGYIMKHQEENDFYARIAPPFMAFIMVVFMLFHMATYSFTQTGLLWFFISSAAVFLLVYRFRPTTYPMLTQRLPSALIVILQAMGRNSLIFYVFHVVLFMAIGMALGSAKYHPFSPNLFPF